MPYIKPELRPQFEEGLANLIPQTAGELNYMFTKLCIHYCLDRGGFNYQLFNDCIGALEGCKLELYRKFVAPYEEIKEKENGKL